MQYQSCRSISNIANRLCLKLSNFKIDILGKSKKGLTKRNKRCKIKDERLNHFNLEVLTIKKIKNVLCFFLSMMMLLCCSLTASADSLTSASVTPKISFAGHLVIYASNNGASSLFNTSGHAFLSFKNTSSSSVTLGPLEVQPGHEVTFGTWRNTKHRGIWYNLEAYLANHENDLKGRISLVTGVTYSDLATINSVIENNDRWSETNNCSTFAVKVWNSICSDKLKLDAGVPNSPTALMASIRLKSGYDYETNRSIEDASPIGYINSAGDFVTVDMTEETKADILRILNDDICTPAEPVAFMTPVNMDAKNCEAA